MTRINLYTGAPEQRFLTSDRSEFSSRPAAAYKTLWAAWPLTRKFNMATPKWSHPIFPKTCLIVEVAR